jgi:RNA polymerase sigma factor (sigma-70 family)
MLIATLIPLAIIPAFWSRGRGARHVRKVCVHKADMNEAGLDRELVDLIARMATGEEAALGRFYDLTLGRVFALARRIVGSREAAEDVAAEVYLQAWRQAGEYSPARGAALAWLLIICRSRALDSLRRRDEAEPHPDPASLKPEEVSEHDNPVDLLQVFERDSAVHAAMTRLSPVQRQLIALHFFRGLSHQEIAEHLDMALGTVKSHLRRGLSALQEALVKEGLTT